MNYNEQNLKHQSTPLQRYSKHLTYPVNLFEYDLSKIWSRMQSELVLTVLESIRV